LQNLIPAVFLKPVLIFLPERVNRKVNVMLLKVFHAPYAGMVYVFERWEAWRAQKAEAKRIRMSLGIEGEAVSAPESNAGALWRRYANARIVKPVTKKTAPLRGAKRSQLQVPVALLQKASKRTQKARDAASKPLTWPGGTSAPAPAPAPATTPAPASAPAPTKTAAAAAGAQPAAKPAKTEPAKPEKPAKAGNAGNAAPATPAAPAKTAPAAAAPAKAAPAKAAPAAAAPAPGQPVDIRPSDVEMMRMLKELSAQVEELRVFLVKHDQGPEQA
jgi:hypothetical protein